MSTTMPAAIASAPYASSALDYYQRAWPGVIPVRNKYPPVTGYTGNDGAWPSPADIMTWSDGPEAEWNVALRLPAYVIGIDVDHYGGKPGKATLAACEAHWGLLPATWISTSRDDGTSGIRFYRVPAGLAWPSKLPGGGVEIVRTAHRYAMVWPSVHPEGRVYQWITPDGEVASVHGGLIPSPDELPDLPPAWIEGLTAGKAALDLARADMSDSEAAAWLDQHGAGTQCLEMIKAVQRATLKMADCSSRHDAMTSGTARIAHLVQQGHLGGSAATAMVREAFDHLTAGEDRDPGEFIRALTGAVRLAAAVGDVVAFDPCTSVFGTAPATPTPALMAAVPLALDGPESHADASDRPTWAPVDLSSFLDGTHSPSVPTLLSRTDGQCLLYPGLIHSIHGESESGKSMIVQAEAARLLADGEDVAIIDLESDEGSVTQRLIEMGAPREAIRRHLTYVRPEINPHSTPVESKAFAELLTKPYALAVIDGVTDALGLFGAVSKDNDAVTAFMRALPKAVAARTGAAVVLIDHVTKDSESRGRYAIGGQAKLAALTGSAYTVEVAERLGRGLRGVVVLRIAKDRPGAIRAHCGPFRKSDRTQEAARIVIDSTGPAMVVTIGPPSAGSESGGPEPFRPTSIMEKVSGVVASTPDMTKNQIAQSIPSSKSTVLAAIDVLVAEGYLTVTPGPNRSQLHRLARAYWQEADPKSDRYLGERSA